MARVCDQCNYRQPPNAAEDGAKCVCRFAARFDGLPDDPIDMELCDDCGEQWVRKFQRIQTRHAEDVSAGGK